MKSVLQFIAPPSTCGYLPDQCWQLEYEIVSTIRPEEYLQRLLDGWRRFGVSLFHPRCPVCSACRSLRVLVPRFRPDRRLRRARQRNAGAIRLEIGVPRVTREKLRLLDRYHAFQSDFKDWPVHEPKDALSYNQSFVDNPLPGEEWCYYLGDQLVGVGYVDVVPTALSAIYFFYDPDHRERSLGTWNVLALLDEAARWGLEHLYLGYFVDGCRSMEYKASFRPNETRGSDGRWTPFRE